MVKNFLYSGQRPFFVTFQLAGKRWKGVSQRKNRWNNIGKKHEPERILTYLRTTSMPATKS